VSPTKRSRDRLRFIAWDPRSTIDAGFKPKRRIRRYNRAEKADVAAERRFACEDYRKRKVKVC